MMMYSVYSSLSQLKKGHPLCPQVVYIDLHHTCSSCGESRGSDNTSDGAGCLLLSISVLYLNVRHRINRTLFLLHHIHYRFQSDLPVLGRLDQGTYLSAGHVSLQHFGTLRIRYYTAYQFPQTPPVAYESCLVPSKHSFIHDQNQWRGSRTCQSARAAVSHIRMLFHWL